MLSTWTLKSNRRAVKRFLALALHDRGVFDGVGQCSSRFFACDPSLLKIFVVPTIRYGGTTTKIKLKYGKETLYKQHIQFTVCGRLELAH